MEPIALKLPNQRPQKETPQRPHEIGEYLKVDRFEVVETYKDQDPRYVAITADGEKLPIPHAFSGMVGIATGVQLRHEGFPGLFSNDELHPYVWVPVRYNVGETGRTTGNAPED